MATVTHGMKYPYNWLGMPLYLRIVTVNELKNKLQLIIKPSL